MAYPEAADGPAAPEAAPPKARLRVFVAWCAWLLAWLVPSMLLEPHAPSAPAWMTPTSAPAALLAAVGLFLVAAWPFFPALAPSPGGLGTLPRGGVDILPRGGSPEPPRHLSERVSAAERGGSGDPPRGNVSLAPGGNGSSPPRLAVSVVRLIGLALAELAVLAALAAPFAVVAWSLGEGRLAVGSVAATAGGLGVLGLGLRVAASAGGPSASRWLMAGALVACAAPAALAYAAAETVGGSYGWLAEASPVVALVQAGDGWPEGAWPQAARLWLWPAVGVVVGVVGAIVSVTRVKRSRGA